MRAALRIPLLVLVVLLAADGFASAGQSATLTIRNDSNRTVVVQETVVQNGQVKRLRPLRLLPGESVKLPDSSPGVRNFDVFDAQSPAVPLWSGKVAVGIGNRTIAVTIEGKTATLREVPTATLPGSKRP